MLKEVEKSVVHITVSVVEPRRAEEVAVCSEQNDNDHTPGDDNSSKSDQSLAVEWKNYGDAPFHCQQDQCPGRQLDKRQQDTRIHTKAHVKLLLLFYEIHHVKSTQLRLSNNLFFTS